AHGDGRRTIEAKTRIGASAAPRAMLTQLGLADIYTIEQETARSTKPENCSQDRHHGRIATSCVWSRRTFSKSAMNSPFNGTMERSRISISNFSGARVHVRPAAASRTCSEILCPAQAG